MAKIIGIDLGTTNSVVAVMEGGEPKVIANEEGGRTTPSVVAFTKTGERLVGQVAKRQAITNPENTIYSIKRFMGRRFDEVSEEMKMVPYKVVQSGDHVAVVAQGKEYTPPQISAMILQKLKKAAEDYLGEKVTEAVITVPAYFNDAQRQATKDAGKIAGLEVKRIINEPTAAALAYGLDKKKDETIAVYDFGGGTFDISILEVGEGVIEVKSTNGDTHLGGDNLDQRMVDWLIDEFKKDEGLDLRGKGNEMALQRLRDAAERAKIELSTTMQTEINLPFITADACRPEAPGQDADPRQAGRDGARHRRAFGWPCRQAMKDAGVDADKIDEVVLVGGQTRMPAIQTTGEGNLFGKEPHKGVNPDEVVAVGAAIQGGVLGGEVKDLLLLDVTPLTLAIETLGGVATPMIPRNTTIPTRKTESSRRRPTARRRSRSTSCRASVRWRGDNRTLGKFHLTGIPHGAARRAANRGDLRHRRQRHPERYRQGHGHQQGSEDHHHLVFRPEQGRGGAHGQGSRSARGRRQAASATRSKPATSSTPWSTSIEKMLREHGDKISGTSAATWKTPWPTPKRRWKAATQAMNTRPRASPAGFAQAGRGHVQGNLSSGAARCRDSRRWSTNRWRRRRRAVGRKSKEG